MKATGRTGQSPPANYMIAGLALLSHSLVKSGTKKQHQPSLSGWLPGLGQGKTMIPVCISRCHQCQEIAIQNHEVDSKGGMGGEGKPCPGMVLFLDGGWTFGLLGGPETWLPEIQSSFNFVGM